MDVVAQPPTQTHIDMYIHRYIYTVHIRLMYLIIINSLLNALDHIGHMSRPREMELVHHVRSGDVGRSSSMFPVSSVLPSFSVTTTAVGTRPDGHTGRNGSLLSELKGRMSSDFVRSMGHGRPAGRRGRQ